MDKIRLIIEKTHQALNVAVQEMKTARDYGNGIKLYYSEIHSLEVIKDHERANISELAEHMAVTIGAVWQGTRKLEAKGLIEKYQLRDNRKDVYFCLTESGRVACAGHDKYHEALNPELFAFIDRLNENETKLVLDFLEQIVGSMVGIV
jgi:DNA-binding MarR family transcriptional regulator